MPATRGARKTWEARLALGFRAEADDGSGQDGRTVLSHCLHSGPLVVQKALYPEGRGVCHAVVLHPPAGVAGGDALLLDIDVGANAHAVVSTPGATRWYKSAGRPASQDVRIRLGRDARLDWLPQENLIFDGADAELSFLLEADAGARALGWDILMLGRRAAGETFARGQVRLASRFARAGVTLWREQGRIAPPGDGPGTVLGLAGAVASATLWALGPACTPALAEELGAALPYAPTLKAGASALPGGVLLVRILASEVGPLRALCQALWSTLRPAVLGRAAQPLRLWNT